MESASFHHVVFFVFTALFATLSRGQNVLHVSSNCHGVYYDRLGCFTRDYPFNNTPQLPQNPNFVDTTFYLYTRSNPHQGQLLSARNESQDVGGSNFNSRKPVEVLVHGFLQNDRSPWVLEMTHTFLEHKDVNVITVSWGAGAGFPYSQAAANTRVAGAELARLIIKLGEQKHVSPRKFHLIGHSLGAHVAGHAGNTVRSMNSHVKIGRITGLDPADPNFSFQSPEVRLDPSDARWVDVIHTDGAPYNTYGGYGTFQAMGHIDFYPNGGKNQPGCHTDTSVYNFVRDAYQQGVTNAEYAMACSHDRSILLFIKSIASQCPFTAYPCASEDEFRAGLCLRCGNRPCPSMGYGAQLYRRTGRFYLHTLAQSPFCGYHYLVRMTLSDNMRSTSGQLRVKISGDQGQTAPLLLHDGDMTASQEISSVMLSTEEVGHVTNVTFTFTRGEGYLSWLSMSSSEVRMATVMVEGVNRRNILYFCPESSVVQPGQPLQLSNGTRRPGNCFQH